MDSRQPITGARTTDEDGEIDVVAFSDGNPADATCTVTLGS